MKHEGCARQAILKWGKFVDLEMYAILREEIPAVREKA
jgi:RimJ/RimL family protein N-acetyltransferase